MRIFIALLFSEEIKVELYNTIDHLRDLYDGNYTSFDNLHLTLHYIGEVDELLLEDVKTAIKSINFKKFKVKILKLSSFKNTSTSCLVHRVIEKTISLKQLHLKTINALKLAGIKIDSDNFTPHITLGRKVKISKEDLLDILVDEVEVEFDRISIMESKRVDGDLIYEELDHKKFF
ncbi:MAG: RNA 2',3'-cyclic phosphodiesterase [Candidatus Izemoplasmatales bacterium]|nr:RNA 2',3'-cyclic phosphodiesterase [Candidatus Izemoplasmatales bacterium]